MTERTPRIRLLAGATAVLLGLLLFAAAGAWLVVRASLPRLDGVLDAAGLGTAATVERDEEGVPTIRAGNRRDLAFATGLVHAQDRFFQMDLQRRLAAGELAELIGASAVEIDRSSRVHGFRGVAQAVLARLPPEQRTLLESYAAGVNRGLRSLGVRPFEYLVLGSEPVAWRPEDSLLVAYAMYMDLNDVNGDGELAAAALKAELPPAMHALLHPFGSEWDAPVDGGTWRLPPLPGPDVIDVRDSAAARSVANERLARVAMRTGDASHGSNSWAVAGAQTASGTALLANDMHLGLQVPNVWYRARLVVDAPGDAARDLIGVTLAGLPLVIAGSNRSVAWGFTNTHGDWTDLVIVRPDPQDAHRYLVDGNPEDFRTRTETVRVRGGDPIVFDVQETRWGPVIGRDGNGTLLAQAWTAHRPEATNLDFVLLETVRSAEDALRIANQIGAPVQNLLVADAAGHIGWTLLGRVPVRTGYDSRYPAEWSAASGWTGWRAPAEYPRVLDPLSGRLWTANSRTIDARPWLEFVGPGDYVLGARAGQIRDGLLERRALTTADMLAIQLDDRALFLTRWRDLLLAELDGAAVAEHARRATARDLVLHWSGRADVGDAGYRIVRAFRSQVMMRLYEGFTAAIRRRHPDLEFEPSQQWEGPVWQLLTERPAHLLPAPQRGWDEALLAWLDETLVELGDTCGDLAACTWGARNELAMRHPLSQALPLLSGWLDMDVVQLPGDSNMPRVQSPRAGATERFVIPPGHEEQGYFQMPGGQSGHPLSPFYRAGHAAWAQGTPRPLLPGPTQYTLRLQP